MDISMEDLSVMSKQSFELIFRMGQFYMPKIAVSRSAESKIEIAQYEGGFEQLNLALDLLAKMGPIEWISHTADSYTVNLSEDDPLFEDISRGITSATAMFQDGDPRAFEALQLLKVTWQGEAEAMAMPYMRHPDRIEWIETPTLPFPQGRFVKAIRAAIEASHTLVK